MKIHLIALISLIYAQDRSSLVVDEQLYDNGSVKHKRVYRDGFASGKWFHFYENGNIWIESKYENGIKTGTWTTYYDSGKIWTKGNYKNNERSGEWIFYN